jgi:hypothetical protein
VRVLEEEVESRGEASSGCVASSIQQHLRLGYELSKWELPGLAIAIGQYLADKIALGTLRIPAFESLRLVVSLKN